jgi:hypothetical protein
MSLRSLPRPNDLATVAATSPASRTGASSTSHGPPPADARIDWATSSASRVLPTPPAPTKVTNRCRAMRPAIVPSSACLPTNSSSATGSCPVGIAVSSATRETGAFGSRGLLAHQLNQTGSLRTFNVRYWGIAGRCGESGGSPG